jgi:hypothetical protein
MWEPLTPQETALFPPHLPRWSLRFGYSDVMNTRVVAIAVLFSMVLAQPIAAKKKKQPPPAGVIAASAADQVLLVDPIGGESQAFDAGTVGWLYPAPGGVLFAPDLINGSTTVLDLRNLRQIDRLDGVTMPHFGPDRDRYLVVAGDVMVVSYPDRAVLDRFGADIKYPWQVLPLSNTAVLVLERQPDGEGGSSLVAVDLVGHQVVSRTPLPGDVRRIALSTSMGFLAVADTTSQMIQLMKPASMAPLMVLPIVGSPQSVAFLPDGNTLVAAVVEGSDRGSVRMWVFKTDKKGISIKKDARVPVAGVPVAMAVWPLGPKVAVGLRSGRIDVVDLAEETIVASADLPGEPRDVVWCDVTVEAPSGPEWSDEKPPELIIGDTQPR